MQRFRTTKAALCLLFLSACLVAPWPQPALAQALTPPDISQTKTDPVQPTPTAGAAPQEAGSLTLTLTSLRDEQGLLAMAVPPAWGDVTQGEWLLAGAPAGRKLSASPNQADFVANWGTPGITIYYSTSLPAAMEPEDILAVFDFADACEDAGRIDLPPGRRTVTGQIWQNCADAGTAALVLLVQPSGERTFYGVIEIYLAGVEDLRALAPILASVQFGATAAPQNETVAATPLAAAAPTTSTATLAAPTPAPAATPTALPAPAVATVITERLNLRSGPSTAVDRLTVLTSGMQLTVNGQVDNCAWLRVTAPDGTQGWVSGDPQFINLPAACATIPVAANP